MDEFLIYFNKKRQWIVVKLWDVHPNTFASWKAGRWGYFIPTYENPKKGFFGEVHLVKSRIREDLIVHEMFHAMVEWMWANGETITRRNEERYTEFLDQLVGRFYRQFHKAKKNKKW